VNDVRHACHGDDSRRIGTSTRKDMLEAVRAAM
jgi:hypothetical protein